MIQNITLFVYIGSEQKSLLYKFVTKRPHISPKRKHSVTARVIVRLNFGENCFSAKTFGAKIRQSPKSPTFKSEKIFAGFPPFYLPATFERGA